MIYFALSYFSLASQNVHVLCRVLSHRMRVGAPQLNLKMFRKQFLHLLWRHAERRATVERQILPPLAMTRAWTAAYAGRACGGIATSAARSNACVNSCPLPVAAASNSNQSPTQTVTSP